MKIEDKKKRKEKKRNKYWYDFHDYNIKKSSLKASI